MPKERRNSGPIYTRIETPVGTVFIAFSNGRLCRVSTGTETQFLRAITSATGRTPHRADAVLRDAACQILVLIMHNNPNGEPINFPNCLDELTSFQQAVLNITATIPRGQVRSYGWVARAIGRPDANRAVGTALGRNPLQFVIPCHRVIRADGRLGAYSGGGTETKAYLLTLEGVSISKTDGNLKVPLPFDTD